MTDERPAIVAPDGRPARAVMSVDCPACGAGPDKRIASSGFGVPHPVCRICGHEWMNEVWRG